MFLYFCSFWKKLLWLSKQLHNALLSGVNVTFCVVSMSWETTDYKAKYMQRHWIHSEALYTEHFSDTEAFLGWENKIKSMCMSEECAFWSMCAGQLLAPTTSTMYDWSKIDAWKLDGIGPLVYLESETVRFCFCPGISVKMRVFYNVFTLCTSQYFECGFIDTAFWEISLNYKHLIWLYAYSDIPEGKKTALTGFVLNNQLTKDQNQYVDIL